VAAGGWRGWPVLPDSPVFFCVPDRGYAMTIARERTVSAAGVGYVTRFEAERQYLDRCQVHRVGGGALEYRLAAEDLPDLNAHIVGAIVEEADYRGPVDDQEFTDAHRELGHPLPAAWRAYLQGASWLRRGWLTSGTYVWLYTPSEMLELLDASGPTTDAHPGMAIIGGDGGREQLVVDLRSDPAPVFLIDVAGSG
jgi:hypothetical protein